MTKVHARGGHGRFFKEQTDKFRSIENAKEKIARAQEAKQRQLTDRVKREIEVVENKFESEIVPALARVRIELEQRAKNGGLSREAFVLRVLAIDEFAIAEIRKRMNANEIIKPFTRDIDFKKHRPLSDADRSELLTMVIGRKPRVQRQKSILKQIQLLSKDVPRWALGAV